jgi:hypothetical protein
MVHVVVIDLIARDLLRSRGEALPPRVGLEPSAGLFRPGDQPPLARGAALPGFSAASFGEAPAYEFAGRPAAQPQTSCAGRLIVRPP